MATLDSGFSGECQEDGDKRKRDGDDQLLELRPPVPGEGEGVDVSAGDKTAGAPGASSDLCDNSGEHTLEDELLEDEINSPVPGQDADNVEKTSQAEDKVEEEDVEPPGEEEIEMLQEIPVIRLRSRSSSSSSYSSDSRSRSRSRSRRRSYSTDEDIEIIEDSTTAAEKTPVKESDKSPNSTQKNSRAQNTEGADDDILEVEVIQSNADVPGQRRSSSQDRQSKPNRRKSRDRDQRSRSGKEGESRNSYSSSSRYNRDTRDTRDRHNNNYREDRRFPSVSSATSTSGAYNRDVSNRGSQPSLNYRDWKRGRQHSGDDQAWNGGTQHSGNDQAWNRGTDQYKNNVTANPFSVPPPNYRNPHGENTSIPYCGQTGSHSQQPHSFSEPPPPPGYPESQQEESGGVRCESLTFSDGFDCHSFSSSSVRQNVDERNLSPVLSGGGIYRTQLHISHSL